MTPAQRRYLLTEAGVAAVINAVLSIAFVFLMFGGLAAVPIAGASGLIVDALPQSFMVATMSTLVPTFLTRRRVAVGKVAALPVQQTRPRHLLLRAVAVGAAVAAIAGIAHALLLPLTAPTWPFATVLVLKTLYGALLGAGVAWLAVRLALADGPPPTR